LTYNITRKFRASANVSGPHSRISRYYSAASDGFVAIRGYEIAGAMFAPKENHLMNDHATLKQSLAENEGNVPYMYLDTVGRVTVGVGHMIASSSLAQELSFVVRGTAQPASAAQIVADYNSVSAQPKGMLFTHYQPFTRLQMTPAAVDQLLEKDIAQMESGVRASFRGYDNYPAPAQDALLDMAFNLGVNGLVTKFPKLKAAAEA
jgi:GH24 family phage-related lysozyme (muramidase)